MSGKRDDVDRDILKEFFEGIDEDDLFDMGQEEIRNKINEFLANIAFERENPINKRDAVMIDLNRDILKEFLNRYRDDDLFNMERENILNKLNNFSRKFVFGGLKDFLGEEFNLLLPYAAKKSDMSEADLINKCKGLFLKSVELDPTINGKTRFLSNGFEIYINQQLLNFFNIMSKIWATRVGGFDNQKIHDVSYSFEDTFSMIKKFMSLLSDNMLHEEPILSELELNDTQYKFQAIILAYGQRLALAHELGHVLAHYASNHFSNEIARAHDYAVSSIRYIDREHPDFNRQKYIENWTEAEIINAWGEEYSSDLLGMELVIASEDGLAPTSFRYLYTYIATDILFTTFSIFEHYYYFKKFGCTYLLTSHPFNDLRLTFLRKEFDILSIEDPDVVRNILSSRAAIDGLYERIMEELKIEEHLSWGEVF